MVLFLLLLECGETYPVVDQGTVRLPTRKSRVFCQGKHDTIGIYTISLLLNMVLLINQILCRPQYANLGILEIFDINF